MAGEVGYIAASIKSIGDTKVGDTITLINNPAPEPLRDTATSTYGIQRCLSADGAKSELREALEAALKRRFFNL